MVDLADCPPTSIFDRMYPQPLFRGARIARLGEKYLGPVVADRNTMKDLGESQIGWFVGGVPTFDHMVEHVQKIGQAGIGARWIVIPATKALADIAYDQWSSDGAVCKRGSGATGWSDGNVTFCLPEQLPKLAEQLCGRQTTVAGIILLDPNCIVHKARSFQRGNFHLKHDRPQFIVDFRSKLNVGTWAPPLIIMSLNKSAAVLTSKVTRVYCLEAMQFIDGNSVRCGLTS